MPFEFLRLAIRFGEKDLPLAIGLGTNSHGLLFPFGPVLFSNTLPLRPHARENRLLVLLRKIQPLDLYVRDLDAELFPCNAAGDRKDSRQHFACLDTAR